jgi:hypothetical protein
MAAEPSSLWIAFSALLAYAIACQLILASRLVRAQVPVPWLTLAVPLHLFQRCREYRAVLGYRLQWWGLSADVAVLTCIGLFLVVWFQHS